LNDHDGDPMGGYKTDAERIAELERELDRWQRIAQDREPLRRQAVEASDEAEDRAEVAAERIADLEAELSKHTHPCKGSDIGVTPLTCPDAPCELCLQHQRARAAAAERERDDAVRLLREWMRWRDCDRRSMPVEETERALRGATNET